MKVTADRLAEALALDLNEYREEIHSGVTKAVKDTAGLCLRLLRQNSPKRTGAYSKGWARKMISKSKQPYAYVYNRDRPWLTHLLEEDHAKRNGGVVAGTHHIEAASKQAEEMLIADIQRLLSGD